MTKLPIASAEDLANKYGLDQVIVVAWKRIGTGRTYVTTYGKSLVDCEQAARGGNRIKREILKWPEELCNTMPRRFAKKSEEVKQ